MTNLQHLKAPQPRTRLRLLAASLLLILTTGAGLAQNEELAASQVIRYATDGSQFPSLDPIVGSNNISFPVQNLIFDALVRFAPGSPRLDEIEPSLAQSWEASESADVWTFHLRQGVQFHGGYGELTSADVAFSLLRAGGEGSVVAGSYRNIRAVDSSDPYTVVIELHQPDAFFLTKVANKYGGWIVSQRAVDERGREAFGLAPIGSGPFQLSELVPGEVIHLSRFEDFWRGTPIIERIEYLLIPDLTTRTLALINGEVDVIRGAVSAEWSQTITNAGLNLGYSAPGQVILIFNLEVEPFDDIRVRQAIGYTLGREAVLEFYAGTAEPQHTNVPPYVTGSLGPEELPEALRYDRDLERARALLAEAGYPDGFEVDVLASQNPDYNNALQIWQELLRDVGIVLNLTSVDHTTYHARIRSDETHGLIQYGGVKPPVPNEWLSDWYTTAGTLNFARYGFVDADGDGEIDSIDHLVLASQATLDPEAQRAAWAEAQIQLLEHLPVFPSHIVKIAFAYRPEVDLGYVLENTVVDGVEILETTRILNR